MTHSLFISYSRQEVTFVDSLLTELEKQNIQIWLDYKSLEPGKPWLDQILSGIDSSSAMLLVVSKESMISKNVALEYQHALKQNKRIILLIFEAVTLPPALQSCEWIDFRSSFKKNLNTLFKQLDQPKKQIPPPQKGFKTAPFIWLSFLLSLVIVLISIPGWWTFFIPILLIPLPIQILKRNFQFYRVRFALLTLPIVLILSWTFFRIYLMINSFFSFTAVMGVFIAPLMLLMISSNAMRRWGKPIASAPKSTRRYKPEQEQTEPVPFFIEYAKEDTKFATAIINRLTAFHHPQVMKVEDAHTSFSIISKYKNTISIDPEKHVVYPILVQDTIVEDKNLQRIQWIDFRRGLKNLDNLAKLLSQPKKLLQALGVLPISQQVIYPRIIQIIDYYLVLLGFFSLSIWIPLWLEFGKQFIELNNPISVVINIVLLAIVLKTVFSARQGLVSRQGKHASLARLFGSLIWIQFISLIQTTYIINIVIAATALSNLVLEDDSRGSIILFLPFSFTIGFILIILLGIFNWKDLTRWFPYKAKD